MSRSKKTRTKSTDRSAPRHIRRLRQVRFEVAAEAARIIATEDQHNYHTAKKKAAERIGVSERLALPSNIEVKDALKNYQALYGGLEHLENLARLRHIAAKAIRLLQEFSPRLVGSVLDGTAGNHARVSLHAFAASPESLILFFLESGEPFQQEQRQIRWYSGEYRAMPLIVFELDHAVVEVMVFDPIDLRQAPPSPIDGKPQRRAGLAEVEEMLGQSPRPAARGLHIGE